MGSSTSRLLDAEMTSWVLPHKLNYSETLRNEQIRLLENFGPRLKLCFRDQYVYSYLYQHWWITDGVWILEFGRGDNLTCSVIVHCNPRTTYTIDDEFDKSDDVMQRMRSVCGATNYSLALRNCEHVARYIHCGAWICFQMVGDGILKKCFRKHLSTFSKVLNIFPAEIQPAEIEKIKLYYDAPTDMIKYARTSEALTEADSSAYNIVFLGPTGSGKSHLINNAFNLSVCETAASVHSVTREIKFYQGTYCWDTVTRGSYSGPVNIIDTIGFCDSLMSAGEVLDAIKERVKVNLAYIDKVVIVCSGRIERPQTKSIMKFMEWLSFTDYKHKFVFIYNKADLLNSQERMTNLLTMCNIFGADTHQTNSMIDNGQEISIKMNLTTGFPPGKSYREIEQDHTNFTRALLCVGKESEGWFSGKGRIPVDKNMCNIL